MMTDHKHLRLRALEPLDVDFMYELENDSTLWQYSDRIAPLSRNQLETYAITYDADPFRAGQLRLVMCDEQSKPLALVDLYDIDSRAMHAYVGIVVAPSVRRRGVATSGLCLLADYCHRHLKLIHLAAKVAVDNVAASALFESCGYNVAGILPSWTMGEDGPVDVKLWIRALSDS